MRTLIEGARIVAALGVAGGFGAMVCLGLFDPGNLLLFCRSGTIFFSSLAVFLLLSLVLEVTRYGRPGR